MPRVVLIVLAGATALVVSCKSSSRRDLAIDYHPGQCAGTFKAPYDATYKLFVIDEAGCALATIDQSTIERCYHVGFVRQPDGTLVGYAAGRKIPLPEGRYRWQITPETRISRADELGANALRVLGRPFVVLFRIGGPFLEALPQFLYAFAKADH